MLLGIVSGIFSLANTFIALFIVIYAFLFLKKTKSHKERRPWDYFIVASTIYLIFAVLMMLLVIYEVKSIAGFGVIELSVFFQFIYTGLILLGFISQTDLMFKNELIIITRKLEPNERKSLDKKLDSLNKGLDFEPVLKSKEKTHTTIKKHKTTKKHKTSEK